MSRGARTGRECRLFINVPAELFSKTQVDRDVGKFNSRMNRVMEVIYANGAGTDSIEIQIAELDAEMQRIAALKASLQLQRTAAMDARKREVTVRSAEEVFRNRVRAAIGSSHATNWKEWLHPKRRDIELFGYKRAKEIAKEEGVLGLGD